MEGLENEIDKILDSIENVDGKAIEIEMGDKKKLLSKTDGGYYFGEIMDKESVIQFNDGKNIGLLKRIPNNKIRDSLLVDMKRSLVE